MKQAKQETKKPGDLGALVANEKPETLHRSIELIGHGEHLYRNNPLAGLAAMYLGMRLLPKGAVPELEKHVRAYETIFMNMMDAQAKTYGTGNPVQLDYAAGGKTASTYKG